MNFAHFINSQTGLIHFIASVFALGFGTAVLAMTKGTKKHRLIGKLYSYSMFILLATAFMTYQLFGKWGIFHYTATISFLTILGGLIPLYFNTWYKDYIVVHFGFMYWSVMGLYAAFASEMFIRIPKVVTVKGVPNYLFYNMSALGSFLVIGIGMYFYLKLRPTWVKQFSKIDAN